MLSGVQLFDVSWLLICNGSPTPVLQQHRLLLNATVVTTVCALFISAGAHPCIQAEGCSSGSCSQLCCAYCRVLVGERIV